MNPETEPSVTHDQDQKKPFVIELRQEDRTPSGYFRPAARLHLTESFSASGLLRDLPPEELKNLLFLLTFVTPNGECRAASHQLAPAMRVSETKARM